MIPVTSTVKLFVFLAEIGMENYVELSCLKATYAYKYILLKAFQCSPLTDVKINFYTVSFSLSEHARRSVTCRDDDIHWNWGAWFIPLICDRIMHHQYQFIKLSVLQFFWTFFFIYQFHTLRPVLAHGNFWVELLVKSLMALKLPAQELCTYYAF